MTATNASDLSPFWTSSVREASNNLWLPTTSDAITEPSTLFSRSVRSIEAVSKPGTGSWFSTRVTKSSASPQPMDVEPPAREGNVNFNNNSNKTTMRTRKIKINATKEQRQLLRKWFGTVRWTYNKCVESACKTGDVRTCSLSAMQADLRVKWVNKDSLSNSEYKWALETPQRTREQSVLDFVRARKAEYTKKRKAGENNVQHTNAKYTFRSQRDPKGEAISISKRQWKDGKIAPTFWKQTAPLRGFSEKVPRVLKHDAKLIRTRSNEYYLCISTLVIVRDSDRCKENQLAPPKIASLDPGVRTFNTIYDVQRKAAVSFGVKDISRVYQMCLGIDRLKSKMTKVKAHQRRAIRAVLDRIRKKIKSLIKEAHCKLAKFLCDHYDVILISKFQVKNMADNKKKTRKIGKKTVRELYSWSHYAFRQRLLHKAEVMGVTVHEVDEAYTSKTCGTCGQLNRKLGSAKTFWCNSCKYIADRDENGARNILLRNLPLVSHLL